MPDLFTPLMIGGLELPNRILMAPLTRCRADDGHVPNPMMAEYYTQRAGAGLIISEATMVMEGNSAFWREPGIYSAAQVAGWRQVTDAVRRAGGRMFLQLWHGGRACHPALNNGQMPVAPSPIAIAGGEVRTPQGKQPHVVPRELPDAEIPEIIEGFREAAENARDAGFDGIELHGANGYLLDEFLRDGANKRIGPYGGPIENRARLLLDVIEAVMAVWGAGRVGVRISPLNPYNGMFDSDPVGLASWVADRLNAFDLAYLHVVRGGDTEPDVLTPIRERYRGVLVGNLGYTGADAEAAIAAGQVDAVAFGKTFLANPDLPVRLRTGAPLNTPHPETFYVPGPAGYIDYPFLPAAS